MKYLGIAVFLLGIALFTNSLGYEKQKSDYKNFIVSNECCIDPNESSLSESEIKYRLEDYSFMFMQVGLIIYLLFLKGKFHLRSPKKKWIIHLIGVAVPVLVVIVSASKNSIESFRYIESYWGGPVTSMPFFMIPELMYLLMINLIHTIGLPPKPVLGISFLSFKFKNFNYWYFALFSLTLMFLMLNIIYGLFLLIIPSALAAYHLMSVLLSIQARRIMILQSRLAGSLPD